MEHEIKRSETIVTLTMTEEEFFELYENFPSRFNPKTSEPAQKIDTQLAEIADAL